MADPQVKYDAQGNLQVWTGTGYQTIPLRIAAGDAGSTYRSQDIWSQGDNPYLIQGAKDIYGITNWNPYSSIAGLQDENWWLDPTNNSADAFSYLLKSGDKVGGRFTYNKQADGSWLGDFGGFERMDTSANNGAALLPLAAAGAMYAAPYLAGGAPAAEAGAALPAQWGIVDTSFSGLTGANLGAAGAATLPAAVDTGMISQTAPLWGTPMSPVPGTVAAGASPWEATLGGFAGAGGFGSALVPAAGAATSGLSALENLLGADTLKTLAPKVVNGLLGWYNDSQAKDKTTDLFNRQNELAGQFKDAGMLYADQHQKLLDANDPMTVAKGRYDELQGLVAPQRAQAQDSLLQQLYNKGGFGLTTNTPTQLGTMGINPYVNSFTAANAQQDKQFAYDAWSMGQRYLDSLIGRQDRVYGAQKNATQDYIKALLGYENERAGQNAVGAAARDDALGNVVTNLPWGSIWDKLSGFFGSKP